jgi:hypothetical protein
MSKFLINLLQISKALIYSKIKFYLENNFPHFGPTGPAAGRPIRTFGPATTLFFPSNRPSPPSPLGLSLSAGPAHLTAQPATFFLLLHRSQMHKTRPPAGLASPARSTPTPSTGRKKTAASIPLHSPINQCHSPLFNHR